jgi:hypothetical protein
MGGGLGKSHRHPEPTELPSVGDERGIIRRLLLKGDIVEPRFEIDHAYPPGPSQLCTVPPCIVELVLVLVCLFVHRNDILTNAVRLT